MAGIFICYRREDSAPYAGRLYDRLAAQFGEDGVFMDVDAIDPGDDFVEVINSRVGACDLFIAVIGRQWLTSVDDTGSRRLDNVEDFVRLEITAAISRKIRIIPILVGGAAMPRDRDLPADVKTLARRQAFEINDKRFHRDVSLLIKAFEAPESPKPDEESAPERAYMSYDVTVAGTKERKTIPLVVGVLADLSAQSEAVPKRLAERRFVDITTDNFSDVINGLRPRLALRVANMLSDDGSQLGIVLQIRALDDFEPEWLARQIEPLRKLLDVRSALVNLLAQYSDQLGILIGEVLRSPELVQLIRSEEREADDFIERRIRELGLVADPFELRHSLATLSELTVPEGSDLRALFTSMVTSIDAIVSRQLDEVMRADEFRQLEATWRGLRYLVAHMERLGVTVRVLDVSRRDLVKDFERAPEFDQSEIFKKVYEAEYGTVGGQPFAILVGDYAFDRHPIDITALSRISNVAAAAQAIFVAAAAPTMFGVQTFAELAAARSVAARFEATAYVKWKSFRESEDAPYVGLAMPRMLLRLPYAKRPDDTFAFQHEECGPAGSTPRGLWGNPAYALAVSLATRFAGPPWCPPPPEQEDPSEVDVELPTAATPTDDGTGTVTSSADVAIGDRRRAELAALGFAAYGIAPADETTRFFDMPSCKLPQSFRIQERTLGAWLSARLPSVLAACRVAHYLHVMLRDKAPGYTAAGDLERYLSAWISQWVAASDSPDSATQASFPFSEARVEVTNLLGRPAEFRVKVRLRPRADTEYVPTTLRLPDGVRGSAAAGYFELVTEFLA